MWTTKTTSPWDTRTRTPRGQLALTVCRRRLLCPAAAPTPAAASAPPPPLPAPQRSPRPPPPSDGNLRKALSPEYSNTHALTFASEVGSCAKSCDGDSGGAHHARARRPRGARGTPRRADRSRVSAPMPAASLPFPSSSASGAGCCAALMMKSGTEHSPAPLRSRCRCCRCRRWSCPNPNPSRRAGWIGGSAGAARGRVSPRGAGATPES